MKFKAILVTGLLATGLIYSCTTNNVEDLRPCFGPADDTLTISFTDTVLPILTRYCSDSTFGDCHQQGSADRYWLVDYPSVKFAVDDGQLKARLIDGNPSFMPPATTLGPTTVTDCEKAVVQRWIEQGALDN